MEHWERAFREKSVRRSRRARRWTYAQRGLLITLIVVAIAIGLWAIDTIADAVCAGAMC